MLYKKFKKTGIISIANLEGNKNNDNEGNLETNNGLVDQSPDFSIFSRFDTDEGNEPDDTPNELKYEHRK